MSMPTFAQQMAIDPVREGYYCPSEYGDGLRTFDIASLEMSENIRNLAERYLLTFHSEPTWHKSSPSEIIAMLTKAIETGTPMPIARP